MTHLESIKNARVRKLLFLFAEETDQVESGTQSNAQLHP